MRARSCPSRTPRRRDAALAACIVSGVISEPNPLSVTALVSSMQTARTRFLIFCSFAAPKTDPMYVSIHKQLTEAGIEIDAPYDLKPRTLEPGQGLSKRMMERIEEDASAILSVAEDALARGDIRYIRYEVDRLLEVFRINLDPSWRTIASYQGR